MKKPLTHRQAERQRERDRIANLVKVVGTDGSLVNELRRLLAQRGYTPRKRIAVFASCIAFDKTLY